MADSPSVDELLALDTDEESVAISDEESNNLLDREEAPLSDNSSQNKYKEKIIKTNNGDDFAMEEELDYEPPDDWDDENDLIVNITEEDMFESEDESFQSRANVDKEKSTNAESKNPKPDSKEKETSNSVAITGVTLSNSKEGSTNLQLKLKDPLKPIALCTNHPSPRFPHPKGKSYPNMLPLYTPSRMDFPPPNMRPFLNHLPINNKKPPFQAFQRLRRPPSSGPPTRRPPPVVQQSHSHVSLNTVQSSGFLPHHIQSTFNPPSTVQCPIPLPPSTQSSSCPPPSVQSSRPLPPSTQSTPNLPPSIQSPSISPPCVQLPRSLPLTPSTLHSTRVPSPAKQSSSSQLVMKAAQSPNFLPLIPSMPSNPPPPSNLSPNLPSSLLNRVRERLSSPSPPMVCWHNAHSMKAVQRGLDMSTAIYSWHLYHACAGFKEKSVSRLSDRFKAVPTLLEVELEDMVGRTGEGGGQLSDRFGCLAVENQNKVVVGKRKRDDDLPLNMKQKIMRRLGGVNQEGEARDKRRERFGEVDMNFFDNVKYLSDKWRK